MWLFTIDNCGVGVGFGFEEVIVVGSLAVLELDPPPETVALFVTLEGAFAATFTVTVIV